MKIIRLNLSIIVSSSHAPKNIYAIFTVPKADEIVYPRKCCFLYKEKVDPRGETNKKSICSPRHGIKVLDSFLVDPLVLVTMKEQETRMLNNKYRHQRFLFFFLESSNNF